MQRDTSGHAVKIRKKLVSTQTRGVRTATGEILCCIEHESPTPDIQPAAKPWSELAESLVQYNTYGTVVPHIATTVQIQNRYESNQYTDLCDWNNQGRSFVRTNVNDFAARKTLLRIRDAQIDPFTRAQ